MEKNQWISMGFWIFMGFQWNSMEFNRGLFIPMDLGQLKISEGDGMDLVGLRLDVYSLVMLRSTSSFAIFCGYMIQLYTTETPS